MKNIIIPWPVIYCKEFQDSLEFLESIGYPPAMFFLDFIFVHGCESWAMKFGDVETWVSNKLDNQFCLLTEIVNSGNVETIDQMREYKIYYDRIYDIVSGDDPDYCDYLYDLVTVLNQFYAHILLPDLGETEFSSIVDFNDLRNGYACVVFNDALGDLINEFYNPVKGGVQITPAFSF